MPDMDWTPVYNEFMRIIKENYTNEEWFNTLSTEEKAEVIAQLSSYGGNVEAILDWLKDKHDEIC